MPNFRSVIVEYFQLYEVELVVEWRKGKLIRRRFWCAGVADVWAVDQHDKWKYKFGLALHTGIDSFIGRILWKEVWWTNSNPRLILSYYLKVVEEIRAMPLVTQSDPGTENYVIANGHTMLRHLHDPSLAGTLQHRWLRQKKNVVPEIAWSQLRRRFTPGFEDILDAGIEKGWYDPGILLEVLTFRWVFIPWLQCELDAYRKRIPVNLEFVNTVRNLFAPPTHEVFQLVPPDFDTTISNLYTQFGNPPVSRDSCWDVYLMLLGALHRLDEIYNTAAEEIDRRWGYTLRMARDESPDGMELDPSLRPLGNGDDVIGENGYYYMGGVNNGAGFGHHKELDDLAERVDGPLPKDIVLPEVETVYWGAYFSDEEELNDPDADEW
ncbi:hypothetical protein GGX14DRAFT_575086 [Mycena pura]|uniref:Uncharacterized protein n=1 Tax=Mycena pura TaxID=153505 RepID=A0AAD6UWE9_9AGAR|nr:hypothetical protein GGX14DRAFT_575086 [Mycena pura]